MQENFTSLSQQKYVGGGWRKKKDGGKAFVSSIIAYMADRVINDKWLIYTFITTADRKKDKLNQASLNENPNDADNMLMV